MILIEQTSGELGIGASDGRPMPFQKPGKYRARRRKNTEYAMYLIRETILRVFNLDGSLYWFYRQRRKLLSHILRLFFRLPVIHKSRSIHCTN
jgi:hypothetical protein